ncbi:1-aminocyclopropane-1-carboxylate oxidase 3-like [Salvia divinorum]|uniref:1-aminocyclopropane-1-carboxylate oxidase 3-like n=1 Tax=Salvia divinorum TaxID=28513 RepID=A0ABD1FXN5_SALDI
MSLVGLKYKKRNKKRGDDPIKREAVVDAVRGASETWGFFQVINHGIPEAVLEEMIDGVRRFFGQDGEERKKWYTRDVNARVVYNSNFDLYRSAAATWRDTVFCEMAPHLPQPEQLPSVCRYIMVEYTKQVMKLGRSLFQILSEALELTLGTPKHTDSDFLTVLLTDQIRGLQVLYQNQWVDVPLVAGALVLVTNDRNDAIRSTELYRPIEVLVSEDDPPRYRATTLAEYITHFTSKGRGGTSALLHFRV